MQYQNKSGSTVAGLSMDAIAFEDLKARYLVFTRNIPFPFHCIWMKLSYKHNYFEYPHPKKFRYSTYTGENYVQEEK